MDEPQIHQTIGALVAEEHHLRGSGHNLTDQQRERLEHVEVQLDQCWDLLRQRDALRRAHLDPEQAQVRPASEVESYLQ
jgi:hypothetical protein